MTARITHYDGGSSGRTFRWSPRQVPITALRRWSRTTSRQRPSASWPDPPLRADALEPDPFVEREARRVLGEDAGEQRPQAGRLGRRDERLEERPTDAVAARLGPDVHALPGDAEIRPSRRVGAQGRPAQDRPARLVAGDEPAVGRDASGRSDASRAPRARAWRRRSRCPRRRSAGPPASRRRSSRSIWIAIRRMMLRAGAIGRTRPRLSPDARRSVSGARRDARPGARPRRRARDTGRAWPRGPRAGSPTRPSRCR